ncbi:MAG TPA: hypothetical protein VGE04_10475 [Chloroflexia bacterium]|jgi:hypothetical protein
MNDRQHDRVEILLICLATKEVSVATLNPQMRLGVAADEYLPSCRTESHLGRVLFDVAGWRVLDGSQTALSARLNDADTLVVAAPEDLPLDDIDDDNRAIPTVETFEEARSRVRSFDHLTHIPQLFRCIMSVQEFEQLVSEAVGLRSRGEAASGERKLLADMMRTCDRAYVQRREYKYSTFSSAIRDILEFRDEAHHGDLSSFRAKIGHALSEWNVRPAYHLLCNAAALHLEPALQYPQSLLHLSETGEIEIGVIRVGTIQEVRLSEIHIDTVEQGRSQETASGETATEETGAGGTTIGGIVIRETDTGETDAGENRMGRTSC